MRNRQKPIGHGIHGTHGRFKVLTNEFSVSSVDCVAIHRDQGNHVTVRTLKPEEYFITEEPYYEPVGDELLVFEAAYRNQLPVLLKGPTG